MNTQLQNGIGIRRGGNRVLYTRITVYLSWTGLSGVRECLSKEVTCGLQPKHWRVVMGCITHFQNSLVEALTPRSSELTVFGDKVFKEGIRFK